MNITSTKEERIVVLQAIQQLVEAPHIKHMSHIMLANETGIKATKIRLVLDELVADKMINRIDISEPAKQVKRYFYTLVDTLDNLVEKIKGTE